MPDIATTLEWYTSRFHCRVKYVDETWALLKFANTTFALVLPHKHPSHLALSRPDANRFGELVPHRKSLRFAYSKDGFGNAIEFLEEPRTVLIEHQTHFPMLHKILNLPCEHEC